MVNQVHFYSFMTGECLPCAKTKMPKGKGIFSLKGKMLWVKTKVELGGVWPSFGKTLKFISATEVPVSTW